MHHYKAKRRITICRLYFFFFIWWDFVFSKKWRKFLQMVPSFLHNNKQPHKGKDNSLEISVSHPTFSTSKQENHVFLHFINYRPHTRDYFVCVKLFLMEMMSLMTFSQKKGEAYGKKICNKEQCVVLASNIVLICSRY